MANGDKLLLSRYKYDGNGDEILTYTAGVGWHEKESKAEMEVHGALRATYYDAFRAARQVLTRKIILLFQNEEQYGIISGCIEL